MQVAYLANNIIDAHLARHLLEDGGVPAFVFGEALQGGVGELPVSGFIRVCIPEGYQQQAEACLRVLVESEPVVGDDLEALPNPA